MPWALLLETALFSLLALLWSSSAAARRDEEIALSSVITRAHDGGDESGEGSGLRLMMAPGEAARFDETGKETFRLHRRRLGITTLVTCTMGAPLQRALDAYRCTVSCQRGDYQVLLYLSPPDPLVVRSPGPGRIEALVFQSPSPSTSPWPFWLAGLLLLAAAMISPAAARLRRRAPP